MGLQGGVTSYAPVGLQDVMPTLLEVAGVPIPESVTGRSVLPLLRGGGSSPDQAGWRDALHGEHSGIYQYDLGVHYLVDQHAKYVWWSQTGREQLFDLEADPTEMHDLALAPAAETALAPWRRRMVQQLRHRPEGFPDGERLIPGRPHLQMVPQSPDTAEAEAAAYLARRRQG